MDTYTFIITSIIIVLLPGTGVIYTLSVAMTEGRWKSIYAVIGCTAGILPHLCASIALTSLLLQMNSTLFAIIKYAGVLYLIYIGWGMLTDTGAGTFAEMKTSRLAGAIIRRGILINLLNPKLTLFFFSFLPQYISADSTHYTASSAMLGLLFMLLTFIIFSLYGILAGSAKSWLCQSASRLARIQKCFGTIFMLFAIRLAL
ncbi:LysE family translocator [Anaerovibrio sp.]|uniref:LysE family translocator n=1 Tax=Anaerovibrio sp. TaxID=1872532 RepID=UPI003F185AAD